MPRAVEELLAVKVSGQGVCRVGVVDGKRPDANMFAWETADTTDVSLPYRSAAHSYAVPLSLK